MSKLSEELVRLRSEKKLSQSEVARRGKLNPSILSRLESDDIASPTAETIRKVARGLAEPAERLLLLVDVPGGGKERDREPLRIWFTHSLWSAPFIPLAISPKALEDIEFTSYRSDDGPGPMWLRPSAAIHQALECLPPRPVGCYDGPGPEHLSFGADAQDGLRTYTANDLLEQVAHDRGAVDCVVAAAEAMRGSMVPCVQISHVFGGCTLLLFSKVARDFKEVHTMDGFLEALGKATTQSGAMSTVPLIFPKNTIASKYADLIKGANDERNLVKNLVKNGSPAGELKLKYHDVDLGEWGAVQRRLVDFLKECDHLLLLAWEPHVSWAIKAVKDALGLDPSAQKEVGLLLANADGPIPDFTFDLLFRRDSERWRDAVTDSRFDKLVGCLKNVIDEISAAPSEDAAIINDIAWYLDMPRRHCFESLERHAFSLRFHQEYLSYLKEKA